MRKNVASQKIGAQMVSASDGSAFTGSVTVYVTGDAGTQAAGSVGSGACTHEGNGYHTYAPAQAETNYDLIAFTFVGTGAVPATVQVFTVDEVWAVATRVLTANTNLNDLSAAGVRSAVGLASANLDTQLGAIDDYIDTEVAAIKAQTDKLTFDGANHVVADARKISTSATAADNLEAGALGIVSSTCSTGSSTTSIVTNLTEATDDHYNGAVIVFTSGALAGQRTSITDYNGTTKTLTVTALTEAPANTDAFVIV